MLLVLSSLSIQNNLTAALREAIARAAFDM
jgi:hypothetical protein